MGVFGTCIQTIVFIFLKTLHVFLYTFLYNYPHVFLKNTNNITKIILPNGLLVVFLFLKLEIYVPHDHITFPICHCLGSELKWYLTPYSTHKKKEMFLKFFVERCSVQWRLYEFF